VASPKVTRTYLCTTTCAENLPLSVLTSIFPEEPGLFASFTADKDDGSGGDNWSCKMCVQSSCKIITTNKHSTFYRPDALPVAQPTVSKHRKDKLSHSTVLLTPSSPGGLLTLFLTTTGSWLPQGGLPCLSSAEILQKIDGWRIWHRRSIVYKHDMTSLVPAISQGTQARQGDAKSNLTMTMILLHIVARRLNRYMDMQKQLKHRKVKWFNNNMYMQGHRSWELRRSCPPENM